MGEMKSASGEKQKASPLQYHPALAGATNLEFDADRDKLKMYEELTLNSSPRRIDYLVVKKLADVELTSSLGKIFRKYNFFEFKSENDKLNHSTYHKNMSYAYQYLAALKEYVSIEDTSISFVRKTKPLGLMKWFEEQGFALKRFQDGIYHVTRAAHPRMQLVVLKELDKEQHFWLSLLGGEMKEADLKSALEMREGIEDPAQRSNALRVISLINDVMKQEGEVMIDWAAKIVELEKVVEQRDAQIEQRDAQIEQRDAQIEQRDAQIEQRDAQIEQKNARIIELEKKLTAAGVVVL